MSTPINELPQVQQDILIVLRSQPVSLQRLVVSLKDAGADYPHPLPHLHALVGEELVQFAGKEDSQEWSLTLKGRVAAELLWFERKYGDVSKLFGALR